MKAFAVSVGIVAVSLLSLGGCKSQASKDVAWTRLTADFTSRIQGEHNELHRARVEGARVQFGDSAASTLKLCYSDGYDTVQNDDHSFRNAANLGPKYVAQCDKIAHAVKESTDLWAKEHAQEKSR
jgi:hypothetical protein